MLPIKHKAGLFFFSILCALCLCCPSGSAQPNAPRNRTLPFKVGVVLDMETWIGRMTMCCMSLAVSDFYAAHRNYSTRLVLYTRNSKSDVIEAASAAMDLLKNVEVQAIIGPQKSAQAKFLVDLGDRARVPIVSFSAISPSLSPIKAPYFIRTAQNDSSQVNAIAAVIRAFGWRAVVLIYEDTEFGQGLIPYLIDALQEMETRIAYRSLIPLSSSDDQIVAELYKLMTMQTRVFIVHMSSSLGSRLFLRAKGVGMLGEGFVWIITDVLTNLIESLGRHVINSMQGVLGVKQYVAASKGLEDFMATWRKNFSQMNPDLYGPELSVLGIRAYDTVQALAIAAEKIGVENPRFLKTEMGGISTDLASLGVSQIGPKFLDALKKTEFKGLGGTFRLVNGELQPSAFQIVNVIGKGERSVGFWTPNYGISRDLNFNSKEIYSTSMNDLNGIIWPGETSVVPKGWVIPTSGKKLRIAVPIKERYFEFLKVEKDTLTNRTVVSGYSIDVFQAVMERLPYAAPYEFIPYQTADGHRAGSYTDLIYQVYLQKYDAMVADTTITANRSLYVDFTLPYTESDLAMIVPIQDDENKKTWIFLKPLTVNLWLTSGAFFIFTGFVVWVLEHQVNNEFRGPPMQQLGLIFWFSFSTLVYAHKEKVINNLSRFVMIIWLFVVLILTSSYTASLTSMMTVRQLQPTITSIEDLKTNGDYVGHQKGPFITEYLKRLGFDESRLRPYKTPEDYDDALSKGSRNGGVAAFFDELPYVELFLTMHCDKYTTVGPTYKAGGFGFAFQKGSPLVPDISRAILNVTEDSTIAAIERKWLGRKKACRDQSATIASKSLTLDSFRGLFLITGITSTSALVLFSFSFFFKHRDALTVDNSNCSIWQRVLQIAQNINHKNQSAPSLQSSHCSNCCIGQRFLEMAQNISHKTQLAPSLQSGRDDGRAQESPASGWQSTISDCTSGGVGAPEDGDVSSV